MSFVISQQEIQKVMELSSKGNKSDLMNLLNSLRNADESSGRKTYGETYDCISEQDETFNSTLKDNNTTFMIENVIDWYSQHPDEWSDCSFGNLAISWANRAADLKGFSDAMSWLDEILIEAKKEFSNADIAILPKTPAAKRKKKKRSIVVERRSSINIASIVKPNGRPRRAAAMAAKMKMQTETGSKLVRSSSKTSAASISSSNKSVLESSYLGTSTTSLTKAFTTKSTSSFVKGRIEAFERISNSPGKIPEKKVKLNGSKPSKAALLSSSRDESMKSPLLTRKIELSASTPLQKTVTSPATISSPEPTILQIDATVMNTTGASPIISTVKKVKGTAKILDAQSFSPDSLDVCDSKCNTRSSARSTANKTTEEETIISNTEMTEHEYVGNEAVEENVDSSVAAVVSAEEIEALPQAETEDVIDKDIELDISEENGAAEPAAAAAAGGKSYVDTTSVSMIVDQVEDDVMETEESMGDLGASILVEDVITSIPPKTAEPIVEETKEKDSEKPVKATRARTKARKQQQEDQKQAERSSVEALDKKREQTDSDSADAKLKVQQQLLSTTKSVETEDVQEMPPPPAPTAAEPAQSAASAAETKQRVTRSKMRKPPASTIQPSEDPQISNKTQTPKQAAPETPVRDGKTPSRTTSPARTKSPARMKSPARPLGNQDSTSKLARTPSTTSLGRTSTLKRKQNSESNVSSKKVRTSSDNPTRSVLVNTLTKASSHSRLRTSSSSTSNTSKLYQSVSTPDMQRSTSFVSSLLKSNKSLRHTPSGGQSAFSFLNPFSAQKKTLTREEQLEIKNQKIKEKQEADARRLEEAERIKQAKLEAKKQERLDKLNHAKQLRQAKLKEKEEKNKELEAKSKQKEAVGVEAIKKKEREEREKAVLRERKLQEAEERRKKEEEARQQKLKAQEAEQKRLAEQMQRKKDYEQAQQKKLELEKQRVLQLAKENALKVVSEARALEGKDIPQKYQLTSDQSSSGATKEKKPSIYEHVGSKMQQLQQQREALLNMVSTSSGTTSSDSCGGFSSSQALNRTFEVEPCDNYMDLSELQEDDEFDLPKFSKYKKPSWATGTTFNTTVVTQYRRTGTGQLDPRSLFGVFDNETPDLFKIFPVHKARFGNRTSSARWPTAPLKELANQKVLS